MPPAKLVFGMDTGRNEVRTDCKFVNILRSSLLIQDIAHRFDESTMYG